MRLNRRSFVKTAVGTGVIAFSERQVWSAFPLPQRPLKILILGGTGFIGPHQVRYALQRGHKITLFNRGKSNPHLFPEVEKLKGDRNNDLTALEGTRKWDAVIDNSASIPRWVRTSANLLQERVGQYLYVSSLSVYSDNSRKGIAEDGPLIRLEDPKVEKVTGETYGGLKVLCEEETRKAFPLGHSVVRPTLIVGPGDPTDRFTYWPVRIDRGGEVLAPGTPEDPVQLIDARDLAGWMIRMLENRTLGTFNATSRPLGMAEMLYGIKASGNSHAWFTWLPASFLEANEIKPWSDMPVWVPSVGENLGFSQFSAEKALSAGLTFRPLAESSRDTLEWFKTLPSERTEKLKAGLSEAREREILALWHQRETEQRQERG